MITRLEKVTLYVESQEAAKKFWTEKLGFAVVFEQTMGPSLTWLEVAPKGGAGLTSLVLYPKAAMLAMRPEMVSHPGLMFTADDVDALFAEMKAAGVEVDEVKSMPWGKMFNFKDPDGNSFMVRG
jgi:lactoylglutathione lyase